MKIYLISHETYEYDSYMAHVVVANSVSEVRELAKKKSADEGKNVWAIAKVQECGEYTGNAEKPFILLSDFHAG